MYRNSFDQTCIWLELCFLQVGILAFKFRAPAANECNAVSLRGNGMRSPSVHADKVIALTGFYHNEKSVQYG